MALPPDPTIVAARETRAWALRSRGWSQSRIAADLGLTQAGVSRLLARVERRELRRMGACVGRLKAVQSAQLDHVLEESVDAWHRSKEPSKRAASRKRVGFPAAPNVGDDDDEVEGVSEEVQTTQVEERDGDTSYLYVAMQALTHQRSIWGLDIAPALNEPASSVAELARDLLGRAVAYEERQAAASGGGGNPPGPRGSDPGGVAPVPSGPEPVQ